MLTCATTMAYTDEGTDEDHDTYFLGYANRSELALQSQSARTLSLYGAVGNFEYLNYTTGTHARTCTPRTHTCTHAQHARTTRTHVSI